MKMIEIKLRSQTAELEKLTARKERAEAKLQKARAKAEKLNAIWTDEEHRAWMDTIEKVNCFIANKNTLKEKIWIQNIKILKI